MKCYYYLSSKHDHKVECKPKKHKEKHHCNKCGNNFNLNIFGISINIGGKGHC